MSAAILPESDAVLAALVGAEQAAWPQDWSAFRAFVAARPSATVAHVADLHLAFSVLRNVDDATAALAVRLRQLSLSTGRARVDEHTLEEARQVLLERLVVEKNGVTPRIATYEGQAPLHGWLRVALAREALYIHKLQKRERPEESDDLLALEDDGDTPELAYLKAHYREKFRSAFHAACEEVGQKERSLLRQHLVLGIGIDRLGVIYGVHRATVARWIDTARDDLMRRTRRRLEAELKLPLGEIERISAMIQSRLDFSLHRVLRTRGPGAS